MDIPQTINSRYRPGLDEDEDWFRYLNLDGPELPSLLDETSFPDVRTDLEVLDSLGGNFSLKAVNSIAPLNEAPLTSIFDTPGVDISLSKRERAPSSHSASLASSNSRQPFKKKARTTRFTTAQTDVLQTWLDCYSSYPYPQRKEKEDLATTSGLTVSQIQAWFVRTRQRKLRPQIDDKSQPTELDGGIQVRQITSSDPGSQHNRSPWRSRGGSCVRSSTAGLSSLVVDPASPQPYHSNEEPDSVVCDFHVKYFGHSGHGRPEPSGLSCAASQVDWWLGTLPGKRASEEAKEQREEILLHILCRWFP